MKPQHLVHLGLITASFAVAAAGIALSVGSLLLLLLGGFLLLLSSALMVASLWLALAS